MVIHITYSIIILGICLNTISDIFCNNISSYNILDTINYNNH